MKISRLYKYSAIMLIGTALIGCDDVKPDDRYILGEEITAERSVLLEDFTGQQCLNCPQAHEVIKELEAQYGRDKVIAVSIHCGTFGFSKERTDFSLNRVGLMTEEGNAILETYGITSFPMGSVDMGSPITYGLWATAVRNALSVPSDVNLDLNVDYTPSAASAETGTIDIRCEVMSNQTRSAEIQFWVIEDDIVAMQKNGNVTIPDYVHDGVFRAQIFPGVKGKSITLAGGITDTEIGSIDTRWNEQERWNVENLYVVAFVSDSNGVLQVTRKKVIPEEESEDANNN